MRFIVTPERSRNMASMRSKETNPEIALRKELWRLGVRNYRKYSDLPGKPDLTFSKAKLAIFVDGCFWHGCPIHFVAPKNNKPYWAAKIKRNRKRDECVEKELSEMGYAILRIWQHSIKSSPEAVAIAVKRALGSKRRRVNQFIYFVSRSMN